ncbi:MAG TPA: hypothetical protein H9700_13650 [Candidatus Eisenbergiella intestinipullorum]|nr:hypothetical protein [Candidatus Eisenbergiella intestinipullorum]
MDDQKLLHAISEMLDVKLGAAIGSRFDDINVRFDAVGKRLDGMDERFDAVEKRLDGMDARFDAMEKRQNGMELRLEKVESFVSALRYGQTEIHKELKNVSARVESTYKLALEAWGQSTENRNLLESVR